MGYEFGEKPRTDGDLISRQEVIEILKTAEFSEDYTVDEIQQALDIAIKALEKTEDVKPIVYTTLLVDEDGNMKCSNCGNSECWGNYCMNCGATMKGVAKE